MARKQAMAYLEVPEVWRMKMRRLFYSAAIAAIVGVPGVALAGIGNGNGVDNGNKNGWGSVDHQGHEMSVPKGLVESGDNGRVDNGGGNGGEHPGHHTPNHHGEDGPHDADPN
ncbi:hypothetical protein [Tropicimonas sp. IMCC6043]|uniref:hypothetical protein n=1 Tax=Tropicimonas sp. IMCC6043 TaxID=2510645 RepID=UPI00101C64B9|nr:hypothetical protein [Tropicimonas sp. IMCC6043]RYH09771.1 hypothetical protein EU800_11045 [Tropicimonas sp. IMCC6043]